MYSRVIYNQWTGWICATVAVRGALVGKEVGRRGVQVSCSEGSERTGGITDMEQREGYGG